MTAGIAIREARRDRRLTQTELARRMGITQPAVARLEAAADGITVATLRRAARALDCELDLRISEPARPSGVDVSQLVELQRLTPAERLRTFQASHRRLERLRGRLDRRS